MSDNQKIITQVSKTVDGFLNQGLHITGATKDTFYLYSTDKEILVTIDLFDDGKSAPEYCVFVHGVPELQKFGRANDFCKNLYEYVDAKYNYDSALGQKIEKQQFKKSDMQHMWRDMRAGKSIEKEQEFLQSLIHELVKRKCPIDLIQRMFYCFGNSKHSFDKQFTVLNTVNKLVEYKTARGSKWFFTGENSTGKFMPSDAASKQIFDKVKIALQNQKTK